MAKPTRSRPRSSRSVSPSASPSTISTSFERSIPRQIAFVIRCMRASVAFFFVSSSAENRRTARAALLGFVTAAWGGVRSKVLLITAVKVLGLLTALQNEDEGPGHRRVIAHPRCFPAYYPHQSYP